MGQYIKKYEGDKILDLTKVGGDKVPNPTETFEYITKVKEQGGNTTNSASMERKLNEQKVVPSIQLIPSGVGTGVLNTLEEDNNFTVVRGSAATYVDEDGVVKTASNNVPRVDFSRNPSFHTGVGDVLTFENNLSDVGALLTEPQSQNLIPWSDDLTKTGWVRYGGCHITGTNTVNSGTTGSGTSSYTATYATSQPIGEVFSYSFYIKNINSTASLLLVRAAANAGNLRIEWSGDTIVKVWTSMDTSFRVTKAADGFYKIEMLVVSLEVSNGVRIYPNYTADGVDRSVIVKHCQVEKSPVSTSYIPTTGSTVVRIKDVVAAGGNVNNINSSEGVLFVETAALAEEGVYSPIELGSAALNGARIRYGSASNQVDFIVLSDIGVGYTKSFILGSVTDFHKFALKYKSNDFSAWVDGVKVDEQFSGDTFTAGYLTHVDFGRGGGQLDHVYPFQGRTRQVKVFKTALSDEELAYLTSPTQQPILKAIDGTQLKPASFTYEYAKEGTKAENLLAVYDNTHNAFPTPGFDFTPSMYEDGTAFPQIGSKSFEVIRACAKTKLNEQGVLAPVGNNEIAIDFSDGSGIGSMNLEPQSTNLFNASEPTGYGWGWFGSGGAFESHSWAIGLDTCVRLIDNSIVRYIYIKETLPLGSVTCSFYIEMDDGSKPVGSDSTSSGDFNIAIDGSRITAVVEHVSGNVWRAWGTKVITTSSETAYGPVKWTGQSNKGFRVTGLQLEIGDTPTSYIPTTGSTAVRLKDSVINGGTVADFNSEEGVLFVEGSSTFRGSTIYWAQVSGTLKSNRVLLYQHATGGVRVHIETPAGTTWTMPYSIDTDVSHKYAISWKVDDFSFWVDGTKVATLSSGVVSAPGTFIKLNFSSVTNDSNFSGRTRQVKVFNTALTDSQLKTLTT